MEIQSFERMTSPFLMAMTTACVRALAFSFRSMDVMWFLIVCSVTSSLSAICLFRRPSAMKRRTSISFGVRGDMKLLQYLLGNLGPCGECIIDGMLSPGAAGDCAREVVCTHIPSKNSCCLCLYRLENLLVLLRVG
jgi:hypothetical protein